MNIRIPAVFLFVPLLIMIVANAAFAQWVPPCVDSTRANPYFSGCGSYYQPVCACNNITYRNDCAAVNMGGIVGTYTSGVCSNFEFEAIPTILSQYSGNLQFNMVFKQSGSAIILILDLYGKLVYSYSVSNVPEVRIQLEPYLFRPGLHFIAVISGGERKVQRFIKLPED